MQKFQPLNITIQAKGGVGKSVAAIILAQYLKKTIGQENIACIDTDPSNASFAAFKNLNVVYFNPVSVNEQTGETKVDTIAINTLFERIIEIPQAIVMDTGSSNYIDLKSYLEINQTLEVFAEEESIAREVVLHVPVNGGADFLYCLKELQVMAETFKTVNFVVWLNSNGGELHLSDGRPFEETKIYQTLQEEGRLKGVVVLPPLDQNQSRAFKEMLQGGLTFEEAQHNPDGKMNILKKRLIDRLRQGFYSQLEAIFPPPEAAEATQEKPAAKRKGNTE